METYDISHGQASALPLIEQQLFQKIAVDLHEQGYSINPAAVPFELTDMLLQDMHLFLDQGFKRAAIGRAEQAQVNQFVRSDSIHWIDSQTSGCIAWNNWVSQLQASLNQQLFLGLTWFESHFARYEPGAFYKRHYDAFRGQQNRILSVVTYLNSGWSQDAGGELVLYLNDEDQQGVKVTPLLGTLVVFLSEEFPHEVLPALHERFSIAGWFRTGRELL